MAKARKKVRRKARRAEKKIKVSRRLGKLHVPKATTVAASDNVVLENTFDEAVHWSVPKGVFEGGAVDEVIASGASSGAKRPIQYGFEIRARYQVQPTGKQRKRRKRSKRRMQLADPVIIIEG